MAINELILENLRRQRASGAFCDLKLEVGAHHVWAHSAVVTPFSKYLGQFRGNVNVRMEVEEGCLQCLERLLDVMYGMRAELPEGHANHALEYCKLLLPSDELLEPLTSLVFKPTLKQICSEPNPPPVNMNVLNDDYSEQQQQQQGAQLDAMNGEMQVFDSFQPTDASKVLDIELIEGNYVLNQKSVFEEIAAIDPFKITSNPKAQQPEQQAAKKQPQQQQQLVNPNICCGDFECHSLFRHPHGGNKMCTICSDPFPYGKALAEQAKLLESSSKKNAINPGPEAAKNSKELHCMGCDFKCHLTDTLYRHLQETNHGSKVCSICKKPLPYGKSLAEHLPCWRYVRGANIPYAPPPRRMSTRID